MAVTSTGRRADLQMSKKCKDREMSPELIRVWTEPSSKLKVEKKVPVVYYLSRNGQLDHPHFMEVALSSSEGLYLRDVIDRLNFLRGKGMAGMYSWSCKRSYKNGFVWHDLAENDFIYPAHGQEYVLKGSELLDGILISRADERLPTSSTKAVLECQKSGDVSDFQIVARRRNQSWSAMDFHEYKVYKADSPGEYAGKAAADASTQTDDKRRRRRAITEIVEEEDKGGEQCQSQSTELSTEEISPPPSDSSPETLETLMKADGRVVLSNGGTSDEQAGNGHSSGRFKASSVLMQLISCGSISFKDCGATYGKDMGLSLISHYKSRLPRGGGSNQAGRGAERGFAQNPGFKGRTKLEDKEYFSGSLIETKKDEFPALKRSSSYNADRTSQLDLTEDGDGARARCIPRKPKPESTKKGLLNGDISCSGATSSSSQHDSKRE